MKSRHHPLLFEIKKQKEHKPQTIIYKRLRAIIAPASKPCKEYKIQYRNLEEKICSVLFIEPQVKKQRVVYKKRRSGICIADIEQAKQNLGIKKSIVQTPMYNLYEAWKSAFANCTKSAFVSIDLHNPEPEEKWDLKPKTKKQRKLPQKTQKIHKLNLTDLHLKTGIQYQKLSRALEPPFDYLK